MGFEYKFPDVGEGLSEGKLVKWLVKEGDTLKADQSIAEVETDKAVVEVPIPQAGKVEKLLYNEGDTMTVGEPMIILGDGSGASQEQAKEDTQKQDEPEATPPKQEAQPSKPETKAHESPENKKTNYSAVEAMPAVRKKAKELGIDITLVNGTGKHGQVTMSDLEGSKEAESSGTQSKPEAPSASNEILATPSTRKFARELGVDISKVTGSGENASITKDDIQNASKTGTSSPPQPASKVQSEHLEKKPAPSSDGSEERIPMSGVRKAIAKKMVQSKTAAPHMTISDEADVSELVAIRKKEKDKLKEKGVKLTYLPFFIKALVSALKEYPNLNSSLDDEKQEIILKKFYNIGIAMDTEAGLMVSVVKDADHKSIIDMAKEIADLAGKAKDRKLSPEEMKDSTITITSLGALGGQVFTPIINYPEGAILGIGRIVDKPVAINGEVQIRKMCTFSVSCDHRIIDGADAARFLTSFIKHIEDPDLLFMEMI